MLFDTQIKGRTGSPSVAGSTRRSSAGMSPGSFSHSGRRPPPARRTRPRDPQPAAEKPRGKPFVKGEDSRRVIPNPAVRQERQANEFTREMKACLLGAAEDAGNRMVAISNARLPTKPNKH